MQLNQASKDNTHVFSFVLPAALAVFVSSLLIAYFETLNHMVTPWLNARGFYSHSILLVLLVLSLLWRDRHTFTQDIVSTSVVLNAGIVAFSMAWFLSWAANMISVQIFAVYAIFCLGFCAIAGRGSYRRILPILALLLFTLPLWRPVQPVLQYIASAVVQVSLQATNIPVFVDGNTITIPAGVFAIEGGCSGIGFILVSLSLSGYLALYDRVGVTKAICTMLLSMAIAFLANWVRIYLIILVGYFQGMDHPLIADHVGFGWIIFSVFFFPFLYFLTKTVLPQPAMQTPTAHPQPRITGFRLLSIVLLASIAPIAANTLNHFNRTDQSVTYILPATIGPYQKEESIEHIWQPSFTNADRLERAVYIRESDVRIQSFTASYIKQSQSSEVVNMHNSFVGQKMRQIGKSVRTVPERGFGKVTELTLLDPLGNTLVVWYWYYIGESRAHSGFQAKFDETIQKILGRRGAVAVALSMHCMDTECTGVADTLQKFVTSEDFPTQIPLN